MLVEHIIFVLVIILGLSLIARPISKVLHMPFASILVLIGFLVSELVVYAGYDTGIRADNFQSIIFYVFIPVLVFESAYNIDKQQLKNNIVIILFLAIISMLLSCFIVAVLLFYGIGHESGFPWIAALITGSILAATDPVAVVEKLKEMKAPKRISVLLEGESLFNDATAIVLFGLFLSMATAQGSAVVADVYSVAEIIFRFSIIFFGGVLVGMAVGLFFGFIQSFMQNFVQDSIQDFTKQELSVAVLSLLAAYGSYLLAEYLKVSGVMATLLAALCFSILVQRGKAASVKNIDEKNKHLWNVLSHVANVSVFLVVGAVISFQMFEQRWLAMIIAIAALLVARAVSVYGVLLFFALFKDLKVPFSSQTVMVWSGLRGAVTLALALSLPTSLDYWWTIQSIAFGVVLFSLFIQAPTMHLLVKKLPVQ